MLTGIPRWLGSIFSAIRERRGASPTKKHTSECQKKWQIRKQQRSLMPPRSIYHNRYSIFCTACYPLFNYPNKSHLHTSCQRRRRRTLSLYRNPRPIYFTMHTMQYKRFGRAKIYLALDSGYNWVFDDERRGKAFKWIHSLYSLK